MATVVKSTLKITRSNDGRLSMMSYINLAMFHIVLSKQMLFQGDIILKKQIKKT